MKYNTFPWTNRLMTAVFVLLLCVVFSPFFLLSLFTHPQVDDFCWAVSFRISDANTFFDSLVDWYQGFTGRYFYIALIGSVSRYSDLIEIYKFIPISIFLLWITSSYFLLKSILNVSRWFELIAGALTIFVVYILTMPEVAEFYFMSSGFQYQIGNILTMATLACMIRLGISNRPHYFGSVIAILLFAGIGSSEIHMLFMLVLLLAIVIFVYATRQQFRSVWSLLLVVTILSAALVIVAPGNEERGQHLVARHQLLYSLVASIFHTGLWMLRWIWEPLLWLATFLYVMWLMHRSPRILFSEKIGRIHIITGIFCWLVILFGCFFAGFWAMGDIIPPRTLNAVYFLFLISWFALVTALVTKIQNSHGDLLNTHRNGGVGRAIGVIVATVMIASMFNTQRFSTAYADLKYRADRYDEIHNDRYQQILNTRHENPNQIIKVQGIRKMDRPQTIFFMDIGGNWGEYPNPCYAEYFGVAGIATIYN